MKKILFLLLLSIPALAQIEVGQDSTIRPSKSNTVRPVIKDNNLLFVPKSGEVIQAATVLKRITDFNKYTNISAIYDNSVWTKQTGSVDTTGLGYKFIYTKSINGFYYQRNIDGKVNAKWFGVKADSTVDQSVAMTKAVNYAAITGYKLIIDPGTYRIDNTVVKNQSFNALNIECVPNTVTFYYPNIINQVSCLKLVGGSGRIAQGTINGIIFKGSNTSVGIEFSGQCNQNTINCTFQKNLIGVRFHNELSGSFTELCKLDNCSWETTSAYAIQYKKTNGNNSFHGSGLTGSNYINATDNIVILIDEGCLPYNCPMNVQVWMNGSTSTTFIQNNNTNISYTPYFFGNVTFEHFTGKLVMGVGNPIYFVGGIMCLGDYVESGSLYQCKGVVANKNNSTLPYGIRYNAQKVINNTSVVLNPIYGGVYIVSIMIVTTNYDYRYTLILDTTGNNINTSIKGGTVTILANTKNFNSAGYGPPTFSTNDLGQLTMINSSYPANNTVNVYYTINQIGDYVFGNSPASSF